MMDMHSVSDFFFTKVMNNSLNLFLERTNLYICLKKQFSYFNTEYQFTFISGIAKRPWTLPDPLACCLHNKPCCRRRRTYENEEQSDNFYDLQPTEWSLNKRMFYEEDPTSSTRPKYYSKRDDKDTRY